MDEDLGLVKDKMVHVKSSLDDLGEGFWKRFLYLDILGIIPSDFLGLEVEMWLGVLGIGMRLLGGCRGFCH